MEQTKDVFRLFLRYTSRSVLSMLGLSFYILADTFFVANGVGSMGIAALNIALPVYSLISGTGIMIGMGAATRYCILQGENRSHDASACFTHALWLSAVAGLALTVIGAGFGKEIASLLGADEQVLPFANRYIRTIGAFSCAFVLNQIFVCFVRNDNQPGLAMAAMLTGSLSNVVLDYVFVFPLGMGMFGAALATGLAPVFSMAVLSRHFFKKQNHFHIINCRLAVALWKKIVVLGIPSFITETSSGVIMAVFNFIILAIAGSIGVAAYGVIANLALVVVAIFTGIAQGIQPIVSLNSGLGNHKDNQKVLFFALTIALLIGIGFFVFGTFFASQITSVFNKEQDAVLANLAVDGISLYFPAFIFMGINIVAGAFLSAISKPLPSFAICVARGLVVPVLFAPMLSNAWNMKGVYLTIPFTETFVLLVSIFLIHVSFYKELKNMKS